MAIASGRRRKRVRVGRPRGPAPDPDARRDELLEAAVRAIRRVGPEASMDELAAEAGMTKPILYATFGDKAGLAAALAERYLGDLVPSVLAAFGGGREPKDMVRTAIDTFIGFVERDPQVYRFLVRGVAGADRSFIEQRLVTELGSRLAQVLRTGLRAAGADTGAAEVWSFSILGTVLAGAEWWQVRPTMSRGDLVDYLTELLWGGLSGGGIANLNAAVFEPAATEPAATEPVPTEGKNSEMNVE